MKAFMENYGRIVVLAIMMTSLIVFVFSRGSGGFLGELSAARAEETVGDNDNSDLLGDVGKRKPPVLELTVKKLTLGEEYNLLDRDYFSIKTKNADSQDLPVEVKSIVGPDGSELEDSSNYERFVPDKIGIYKITYETWETYRSFLLSTEKTYQFIVD